MDFVGKVARALCDSDDGGNTDEIFKATEHRGDCTKEAFTCALCQVEMYTEGAVEFIKSLEEKGLVLVPREPTADMTIAGARSIGKSMNIENYTERAKQCHHAMLNAAPKTAP